MDFSKSNIISKISLVHTLCKDFLKAELNKQGLPRLTSSHGHILYLLSKEPFLSMQEIAKKINRDKSTTTVLIKKLRDLGLVEISVSPSDSRVKCVKLSPLGVEYNRHTQQISDTLKSRFFTGLSSSDAQNLSTLLDKISHNFD